MKAKKIKIIIIRVNISSNTYRRSKKYILTLGFDESKSRDEIEM